MDGVVKDEGRGVAKSSGDESRIYWKEEQKQEVSRGIHERGRK